MQPLEFYKDYRRYPNDYYNSCQGDNFTGTKWVISSDAANFGSIGCNDSMSSVKIVDTTHNSTAINSVKKYQYVNSSIMIPGLGTFKVDNAQNIQRVQFTNILGKKVLEIPVMSGSTIKKCNLPYGFYIMTFCGKEKISSRPYKVLAK